MEKWVVMLWQCFNYWSMLAQEWSDLSSVYTDNEKKVAKHLGKADSETPEKQSKKLSSWSYVVF